VAGSANNQLLDDEDGVALHRKGTLYAPDYIINAGGLINIATEMEGPYSPDRAKERTERIYETMERVLDISSRDKMPTYLAADKLAEARLRSVREVRRIFRPWPDGRENLAA
jgi:leucine dehydrogenase